MSYKKFTGIRIRILRRYLPRVYIALLPLIFLNSGLITWRTHNTFTGHLEEVRELLKTGANTSFLGGLKLACNEIMFNGSSIWLWTKFIGISALLFGSLKLILNIYPYAPSWYMKIKSCVEKMIEIFEDMRTEQILSKIQCALRFQVKPKRQNTSVMVCFSVCKDDTMFYSGIRIEKSVKNIYKLHMISRDGKEIDFEFQNKLFIVRGKNGDYLCCSQSKILDENGTDVKKFRVNPQNQNIIFENEQITVRKK